MKFVLWVAAPVMVMALTPSAFSEIVTWPLPEEMTVKDGEYVVAVNGKPVDVLAIPAPSMHDGQLVGEENLQPYFAAFFDADEEVRVDISSRHDLSAARLLPSSRGIRPDVQTVRTLSFRVKPPCKLSFEPKPRHRALVISANLPERDRPDPKDPKVVYFGPGRHRQDKMLTFGTGQTLYLAPGAYVEGAIRSWGNDMRVCGRGILSGLPWEWNKGPHSRMAILTGKDIRIEGVTFVGSWQWCLVLDRCERVCVSQVNILNGHVLNDDGIDVLQSRDVSIDSCFIRTQDDCIAVKGWCENLTVRKCQLWADVANNIRIGYECDGKERRFADLRFSDVDILHQSVHKTPAEAYWSENAICIQASNEQMFEHMAFENFRFDAPEQGDHLASIRNQVSRDQWTHHDKPGDIRGIVLRGISFPHGLPAGSESVWLENVDPARTVADIRIEDLGEIVTVGQRGKVTGISLCDRAARATEGGVSPAVRAATPTAWDGGGECWQMRRHREKRKQAANGGAPVVFIGDSITQLWEASGRNVWNRHFAEGEFRALNLGTSGDRTEHVLWRLTEGRELDGYAASVVVLLIGTNNSGQKSVEEEPPANTVLGIRRILEVIREKQPSAGIVLLPILPCGEDAGNSNRRRNERVNAEIAALADGDRVRWCDMRTFFVDSRGNIRKDLLPDCLHPNEKGYEVMAKALLPCLRSGSGAPIGH